MKAGYAQPTVQPRLPFEPPAQPTVAPAHRNKRGSERVTTPSTAIASEISLDLEKKYFGKRYQAILRALANCEPQSHKCLTAREVLRVLFAQGEVPNDKEAGFVAPRLTELRAKGLVENPAASGEFDAQGKAKPFLKEVIGERPAAVWRITERGRLFINQEGR